MNRAFSRLFAPARLAFLLAGFIAMGPAGCVGPQIAVNSRADFSRVHRVAVATFGGPGGDVAADLLTQDLLMHGADVVERQRLDAILREQHLAADNILDPATVKMMGKVLGVDAIFVGTVANNTPSQSILVTSGHHGYNANGTISVGGGTIYNEGSALGIPDSQVITSAAQASLISRMVDVETGSILWSGRMSYEGLDSQETMENITSAFAESLVPLWPALHK